MRGPLVQAAVQRGAFARFPVALRRKGSAARPHRHLQPLLLRGGSRRARASGALEGAEDAAEAGRQGRLGPAARRHRAVRGLPHAAGRGDSQVLPQPLPQGAEEAFHGAPRQAGQELEILRLRRARTPILGRLHARVRGGHTGDRVERRALVRRARGQQVVLPARRRRGHRRGGGEARPQISEGHACAEGRTSPPRAPSSRRKSKRTRRTCRRRLRFSAGSDCSCSA